MSDDACNDINRKTNILMKVVTFAKKEIVFVAAFLLALVSVVIERLMPYDKVDGKTYLGYINFRVLGLLFCLMCVTSCFNESGLFSRMASGMLVRCKSVRLINVTLVLLPFFASMLVTNDVALITFVPFAIAILGMSGRQDDLLMIVVLQTVAANLGSAATPIGNPQNLYIYGKYAMSASEFFSSVIPIAVIGLVVCVALSLFVGKGSMKVDFESPLKYPDDARKVIGAGVLAFILSILSVFRILDWRITFAIVVILMAIFAVRILARVDYILLLTFVCFFVFAGNMGNIDVIKVFLEELLSRNAMVAAALTSQVISNVPAAVLLSGFTDDARGLLLGVDIGGLGTPVASLASLISMKLYNRSKDANKLKYLAIFTVANFILLILLLIFAQKVMS